MGSAGDLGVESGRRRRVCICRLSLSFLPVTDAYCLLDVYATLSANPASFGLPADLRGACVNGSGVPRQRPERSRDKKQKKAAAVQEQVRRLLCSSCGVKLKHSQGQRVKVAG